MNGSDSNEPQRDVTSQQVEDHNPDRRDQGDLTRPGSDDGLRGHSSYRQLYQTELQKLTREERIAMAGASSGAILSAFCFDPDPGVIIKGVLENPRTGLEQARLIAAHHRTPQGLDGVVSRSGFARDSEVQRQLLRNSQASDMVLRRFLSHKALQPLFQLMIGRELTDRARRLCSEVFKQRFRQAAPPDKVGIVFATEGRCLRFLIGVSIDGRSAALLCERSAMPTLLVQNLARWPTCPPVVLRHLARLSTVRRNPGVMRLIMKHPNCPGEVKRG